VAVEMVQAIVRAQDLQQQVLLILVVVEVVKHTILNQLAQVVVE
jgi:hypothetical protein